MKNNTIEVLIVEDEKVIQDDLVELFSKDARFHLTFTEYGETALTYIHERDFDLVILDLGLAGKMSGNEVNVLARESGFTKPIIVLTGNHESSTHAANIEHGANAYITKPYSHIVLMAYVNQLLDKSLATADPIVRFGPYTFDTFHRRISGRGFESFDIPETGSRILEVLVRSPHPCMNTPTLIREAWGDEIRVQRTTLERNVDRLNEVFRDNGQPNVIRRIPRKEVDIYEVPCK